MALFALGGTIAMAAGTAGVVPSLDAEQLVAAVPGLADLDIDLRWIDFRSRPGASLTIADLTELAAAVRLHFDGGGTGVVITQGTDTIEETAYLLDLLHDGPEPIVVTGAMRNPTLAGPDGPANLLAALQVAASPKAAGLGCLVVFADEIHAAARVRKTHATSPATFASPNGGPLGYLVEGAPAVINRPVHRFTVARTLHRQPRVGLYTATLGDDGMLLDKLSAYLDGAVVAAFGAGHVPDNWVVRLTNLAGRIPVVLSSRAGAGPVLQATYGFAGSERDLLARGLIRAGLLDPYKSRILLHCLLAAGVERPGIVAAFAAAGGVDDRPV
ncbi:MAG TPA: asparaginase [Actinoplanes sp.]|nr:asparaginase [Actinoplanes sp.]